MILILKGSYMSAHVLLNLLNKLEKRDEMRGWTFHLFHNEANSVLHLPQNCDLSVIKIQCNINVQNYLITGTRASAVAQSYSAWLKTEGPWVQASPASLHCGPWARHIYPSLVLVQPRKIRPYITERLLMGCKESNQTNKHYHWYSQYGEFCLCFIKRLQCMFLEK